MTIYSIGELARLTHVGVETVRYYERQGLLVAPQRKASGYRQFDEETVATLHFIRNAKTVGFRLKEIKNLLELRANPSAKMTDVRQQVLHKIIEIDLRIEELQRMRFTLHALLCKCHENGPAEGCPILEGIQNNCPE